MPRRACGRLAHVLGEDSLEAAASEDQDPVEALTTERRRVRELGHGGDQGVPAHDGSDCTRALPHRVEARTELVVAVGSRYLTAMSASRSSAVTLRATCPLVRLVVMPARKTRRDP